MYDPIGQVIYYTELVVLLNTEVILSSITKCIITSTIINLQKLTVTKNCVYFLLRQIFVTKHAVQVSKLPL